MLKFETCNGHLSGYMLIMDMVRLKGTHDAGNAGRNMVRFLPSLLMHVWVAGSMFPSPTPKSPEENVKVTPLAPKYNS